MTVHAGAREEAACAMEKYLNRIDDNYALNKALADGQKKDTACYELYVALVDTLYSIWHRHSNVGPSDLTAAQQRMFRRWIIFLRSSEEWPVASRFESFWRFRLCGELTDLVREAFGASLRLGNEYWPYESSDEWRRLEESSVSRGRKPERD
jgi:hypothetical protein